MRIVFNSAIKDCNGLSLNNCLYKVQDILNNLLHVMLKFRQHIFVGVGGLKKMFHSILTSEVEWNLHRVLYKEFGTNERIKTMCIVRVSFGDRPAPAIAVAALRKTVSMFRDINHEVADQITQDSYMDDCIIGAERDELLSERLFDAEK